MRVLCICQGGNVRSVALATRLKQRYRIDALACGYEKNSRQTLALLCEWADIIVVMEGRFAAEVPEPQRCKVYVCEVGRDRFGRPGHPDLAMAVKTYAKYAKWRHG